MTSRTILFYNKRAIQNHFFINYNITHNIFQEITLFIVFCLYFWIKNDHIRITSEGSLFVRNVAASLDKLMLHSDKTFSKPV